MLLYNKNRSFLLHFFWDVQINFTGTKPTSDFWYTVKLLQMQLLYINEVKHHTLK